MVSADVIGPTHRTRRVNRILMTVDAVGGVWQYAVELAAELTARGSAIMIAVLGPPPSAAQVDEANRIGAIVQEFPGRLEWMPDPWADVERAGTWLLELERSWQPDVVHLNGYSHASLRWSGPVIVVAHSCVCSWWRAVHGIPAPPQWNEYRRRVEGGLSRASVVVSPSIAMAAALRMEHAFEAPVRVIPNARRDPGEAQTTTTKGKQELVFAAGRLWDEGKNIGALSAVAADLDWPVYVAGATQERDGNGPNLTHLNYLGRLDRQSMDRWLRQAAIYALPARYEPFGLSVLEAAMAGCALVLGDIASLRENWNGAALFVPPDDGEALQRTLQRLILDAELREQLAIEAHERAGRFSIADMAGAYLECYTQARAMVAA